MEISVIASGSNGNCCLVEDNGTSVLIDAGKSGKEIGARLENLGKSIENVDAMVITHAHTDHIMGAGVISRRYGIPIYMTCDVCSDCAGKLGKATVRNFSCSRRFRIGSIELQPVETSHDVSSCGFVIGDFGLFTDTGIVTRQMEDAMPKLKAVLLESNHDIDMLVKGPYPYYLKQRILSDHGHLSNVSASELIQSRAESLSVALLGHLSGNNNTPDIARETFETLVRRKIDFSVCSRDRESGTWEI